MKFMMIYLIMINILAFLMMKLDKYKARKHAWRVPEKSFFLLSIIGGSLGTWIGMYICHHKTRQWYFVVGIPIILSLQILLILKVKGGSL